MLTLVFNQTIATIFLDGDGVIQVEDSLGHTAANNFGSADPVISGTTVTIPCTVATVPLVPGAGSGTTPGTITITASAGPSWSNPQTFPVTLIA